MRKFKAVTLMLAAVFALSGLSLAGCKENKIELILKYPKSLSLNSVAYPEGTQVKDFLSDVCEDYIAHSEYNVSITLTSFESGYETDAITNMIGTEKATDILYDNFFNMSSFAHTGYAVPLGDILTEEQRADFYPQYLTLGQIDGKQYMLPYLARQNILIYNRDLLNRYGVDEAFLSKYETEGSEEQSGFTIENWSIERWTDTLQTLADGMLADGRGCVPMMMYAEDNQGDTHIMTLLRAFGSELYNENNEFDLAADHKAVQALEWIQSGVSNGWYMENSFDKTINDCSSKFKVGELAFYHFNLGSSLYSYVFPKDGEPRYDRYGFVNYPGNNCTYFCDGFEIFDNGDAKKIEIAKDFVRFVYNTEKWLDGMAGSLPVCRSVEDKFKDDIQMLAEFAANAKNAVDFFRNLPNWQGTDTAVRSVFYKEIAKLLTQKPDGTFLVTPEECAENLDTVLNTAIRNGKAASRPHP